MTGDGLVPPVVPVVVPPVVSPPVVVVPPVSASSAQATPPRAIAPTNPAAARTLINFDCLMVFPSRDHPLWAAVCSFRCEEYADWGEGVHGPSARYDGLCRGSSPSVSARDASGRDTAWANDC